MNEQIHELEQALAAQVQRLGRGREEPVLVSCEKRSGDVSAPIVLSDSGAGGTALTDPATGLLNQEYFVVLAESLQLDDMRPVAVGVIQAVDRQEGDTRPNAEPVLVAEALHRGRR